MLKILSLIYSKLAHLRRWLYHQKIFQAKHLPKPVISIGNLSVGGTGKTPLTIEISKKLQEEGYKVAVLSKGYKRKSRGTIVVSDEKNIFVNWEEAGDEPYLIARKKIPVVVSSDRYKAGLRALKEINPDIFILDDGFQHFQLHRDIDILLIDATKPFWEDKPLPLGRLREPAEFYRFADMFVITKLDRIKKRTDILKKIREYKKPFFIAKEEFTGFTNLEDNFDFGILPGKKVGLFAGLGNNEQFFKVCESLSKKYSFTITEKISYPDHYDYKNIKLDKTVDLWITTEKDIIKISPTIIKKYNIYALKYQLTLEEKAIEFIKNKIFTKRKKNKYWSEK